MLTHCGCRGTAHDEDCPFIETPGDTINPLDGVGGKPNRGWVCPACGKGNAPWKGSCDCQGSAKTFGVPTGNWRLGLDNTTRDDT